MPSELHLKTADLSDLKKAFLSSPSIFFLAELSYLLKTTCSQEQRPGMCLLPQQSPCSAILVALPSLYHPTYQAIKSYLGSASFLTSSNIPTSTQLYWKKPCKDDPLSSCQCWTEDQAPSVSLGKRLSLFHWSSLNLAQFETCSGAKLVRGEQNPSVCHDDPENADKPKNPGLSCCTRKSSYFNWPA